MSDHHDPETSSPTTDGSPSAEAAVRAPRVPPGLIAGMAGSAYLAAPLTPGAPASAPVLAGTAAAPATERVGRGLLAALVAVPAAGVPAVAVWDLGFVASITSALLAVGATLGHARAAGAPPRRGMLPLLGLILLGVVATAPAFVGGTH